MQGCGWTRCPGNWILSHLAQDTAHSWFWGCTAESAEVLGHFGPLFQHLSVIIVELEATSRLFNTGKPSRVQLVSSIFGHLAVLRGF